MRVLYHFEQSFYSRRCRLALAHKGLEVTLKDGRVEPKYLPEGQALVPLRTMPVFVDEDGGALADSNAIIQYLDVAYPDRAPLLPRNADEACAALAIMGAVDVAINGLTDLGTRYFELRNDPAWDSIVEERIARSQRAIDFVAEKADRQFLVGDAWSAADINAYAAARWVAAFPARASTAPAIRNIMTLGFTMPAALIDWTKQHAARAGVAEIYGS